MPDGVVEVSMSPDWFSLYKLDTGEITVNMNTQSAAPTVPDGYGYIAGKWSMRDYIVEDGVAVLKPAVEVEFDVTEGPVGTVCTLSGLPIPIELTLELTKYPIDDGIFEVTMNTPGEYVFELNDYRYKYRTWELSCV